MSLDEYMDGLGKEKKAIVTRAYIYMHLIREAAEKHQLPLDILAGLVCQESGANPNIRSHSLIRPTEIFMGPCQILVETAIDLGFDAYPVLLCRWRSGLEYGAKHLAQCVKRADGNIYSALLRYNRGMDPDYPERVIEWAELLAPIIDQDTTQRDEYLARKALANGC